MSEQDRKPQPGDMVEASLAGEWFDDEHGRGVYDPVSGWRYDVPEEAVVTVVTPADDPSKDLTGSIRRTKAITCIARERDGGPDYHRWIAVEVNESFTDEHMRDSKVIGVVPGTPAAEAAPTTTGHDDYCRDMAQALGVTRADASWDDLVDEARRIAVHARRDETAEAAEVERDLAASPWNGEPDTREPRVFPCPGPPPPEGVTVQRRDSCVAWVRRGPFVHRTDRDTRSLLWREMVPGEYVEVLS